MAFSQIINAIALSLFSDSATPFFFTIDIKVLTIVEGEQLTSTLAFTIEFPVDTIRGNIDKKLIPFAIV